MPINPFLNGEKFDAETTRAMGAALEMACVALRPGDCADDVKQAIANKIIALARAGEGHRNARKLSALQPLELAPGDHSKAVDVPTDEIEQRLIRVCAHGVI